MFTGLRRKIKKLYYNHKKKIYTNESFLTQEEIDRILEIANELQK